jgi:hypothetical protein
MWGVQVSYHVGGYGPVSFRFDEVEHPVFVHDAAGYCVRFEDVPRDADLLRWLRERVGKRLGALLFDLGVAAPRDAEARYLAGLAWLLGQLERAVAAEAALREAYLALGLGYEPVEVRHLTEEEALEQLGPGCVQDGFGLGRRRLDVREQVAPDGEPLRGGSVFR